MPGPFHGWLLVEDNQGNAYEVINQARTAEYLSNPALALNEVSICDVLDFGGCATYALGPDHVVVSGGHLDLGGTTGNYASIPSGSVAAIPSGGDLTVVVTAAAADWSPGAISTLVAHSQTTAANRSWALDLLTSGALRLQTSIDGTSTTTTHTMSTNFSALAASTKVWLAVTFQANNGAAGRSTRFYRSTDQGQTWVAQGTTQTTAGTTALYNSTAAWTIGTLGNGTSNPFNGEIYSVSIRSGTGAAGTVGGTEIFRFDGDADLVGFNSANPSPWTVITTSGDVMTINTSGSPGTVVHEAVSRCDLVAQTYSTPALDGAPWYNAAYPESADALGFYIGEWTGLDDGHVRRANSPRGSGPGGSSLGIVAAEGRTMALNIMLFARSEAAMDYLFHWLSSTLNSVCSTCATNSILIRRYCGTTSDPWNGVAELRQVGVIQGLKWESDVGTRARCYIRRASFTLMAGDPCMYLPTVDRPVDPADYDADLTTFFATDNPPDDTRTLCRPSCTELTVNARTSRTFSVDPLGAMGPVVTWSNTTTGYTFPFRAIVYADPLEIGTDDPNPCGLQLLGEIYVRALPESTAIRWDVTGRIVEFRDSSTGGWTPSWTYVDLNDPPYRRFFTLPCNTAHLVMEPATMCATFESGTEYTLDGVTYDPPVFPTVDIVLSERLSCP